MPLYGDTSLPPPANPKRSGALLRIIIFLLIKCFIKKYPLYNIELP